MRELPTTPSGAGQSVLIVEPDTGSAAELRSILEGAGFRVHQARAGAEALKIIRERPPDLLITAARLEDTAGWDLCEEVRSTPTGRKVHTILISDEGGSEARLQALERGAEAFIARPYHPAEVLLQASKLLKPSERSGSVGARGGVSGELAEMPIIDLIQFLEMGHRTGVIEIRQHDTQTAAMISMVDGRIVDSRYGEKTGKSALMEILDIQSGQFGFRARAVTGTPSIKESTTALVMEALRRKDERERILQILPPLDTILFRNIDSSLEPLSEKPLADLRKLCDGRRTLRQVVSASGREEIATLVMVKDLLDRQYLVAAPAGQALGGDDLRFCPRCGSLALPGGIRCPDCGARLQQESEPSQGELVRRAKELLGDRYEIQKVLGEGGVGLVFKARDRMLDVDVALKVLRPEVYRQQAELDRIRKEIVVARRLTHPNIIRIFDLGERDGLLYITMEYVFGKNLLDYLESGKRWVRSETNPSLTIVREVLQALEFAHEKGVVHRDIKPQNILIDVNGQIRVADFGLAIQVEPASGKGKGQIVGTPEYISPEQAQGKRVDRRSDLYSIGVLMYQMFTGILPFQARDRMGVLIKQIMEDPIPPRSVNSTLNPDVERVILKAMAKDPNQRYQSAGELMQELERIEQEKLFASEEGPPPPELQRTGTTGSGIPPVQRGGFHPMKRLARTWLLGVVALTLALFFVSFIVMGNVSRSRTQALTQQIDLAIRQGRFDDADQDLIRLAEMAPDNHRLKPLTEKLRDEREAMVLAEKNEIETRLGELIEAGELPEARRLLDEASREIPREWREERMALVEEAQKELDQDARRRRIASRVARGNAALKRGDLDAAERAFQTVLSLQPDHPAAKRGLVKVFQERAMASLPQRGATPTPPKAPTPRPAARPEPSAPLELKGQWIRRAEGGQPAQVGILAKGGVGTTRLQLLYREIPGARYQRITMEPQGDDRYVAFLPLELTGYVYFHVEAEDEAGRRTSTEEQRRKVGPAS